jgi:hypothetical protein
MGAGVMGNRVKVKDMVMEMHEKNLVLMNLIRDIAENEQSGARFSAATTNDEICRILTDKAKRRNELLGEIEYFLYQNDADRRVGHNSSLS